MGFLSKLFGRTISINHKQAGHMVYMYQLSGGKLKLNANVEVKPGFVAVTMHYDDICDVLTEGIHSPSNGQMPKLNRYVRAVRRINGKYKQPKSVRADIYFINLMWFEKIGFTVKTEGIYNKKYHVVKFKGVFDMQVMNSVTFLSCLLKDRAVVRPGIAERESGKMIGFKLEKLFRYAKLPIESFLQRDEKFNEVMSSNLDTGHEFGFNINNLHIEDVSVSQKLRGELETELFKSSHMYEGSIKEKQEDTPQAGGSVTEVNNEKEDLANFKRQIEQSKFDAYAQTRTYEQVNPKVDTPQYNKTAAPVNFNSTQTQDYYKNIANKVNGADMHSSAHDAPVLTPFVGNTIFDEEKPASVQPAASAVYCKACGAKNPLGNKQCYICRSKL